MLEYCLVLQENLLKMFMFHLPKRFENSKLKSSWGYELGWLREQILLSPQRFSEDTI